MSAGGVPQVKGSLLVGAVRAARAVRDEVRPHLDPTLHHYLEDQVEVLKWYPEADLLGIVRALLAANPEGREAALYGMGRWAVNDHAEGVYKRTLSRDEVQMVTIWASQHDTGEATQSRDGGRYVFELRDYGHPSPEMCTLITGYLDGVLERSGKPYGPTRKAACVHDGGDLCRWEADEL